MGAPLKRGRASVSSLLLASFGAVLGAAGRKSAHIQQLYSQYRNITRHVTLANEDLVAMSTLMVA